MHIVSPSLYRGPQPSGEDLKHLKEGGLRSVINLRAESQESALICMGLGLRYYHIPVEDWTIPTADQIEEFLRILDDPANCPALVHCYAGVGRTGLFVSCYRVKMGMSAREAIAQSDRETPWMGMSEEQREFVRNFELFVRGGT